MAPPGHRVVLITEQVHEAGLRLLRQRPDTEIVHAAPSDQEFLPALARADAIGVRIARLDATLLGQAFNLKIVSKHGVGTDAIDIATCTARSIPVTVTPDANTISVAEHTMMLMLAAAKRVRRYDSAVRDGRWAIRDSLEATELAGRTVLVIGFGRIGQRVAAMCQAFGMDVAVFSRSAVTLAGYRVWTDLDMALESADVVTLHLPNSPETANLLHSGRLARMRPGSILVNCARGGIVDEDALAAALRDGRIGAAGIDVFAAEPFAPGHVLATLPNVVLTPHSAASTEAGARRMSVAMAENILAAFDGALDPAVVVNPAVLDGAAG